MDINKSLNLFCGDTIKYLREIPSKSIDLIISSPPYNIGKEYEKKVALSNYIKSMTTVICYLSIILKDGGSICWQVGNYIHNKEVFPLDIYYYPIFKEFGFKLRNRIIWRFELGLNCTYRLSGRYETILWFTKGDNYCFNLDLIRVPQKYPGKRAFKGANKGKPTCNPKGKNPSDMWEVLIKDFDTLVWYIPNVGHCHAEKTIHPAQFPIELVERCVLAFSNEGDLILDPYSGVGSTLIGAIKHNRRAIGIEKEKKYIDITNKRIEEFHNGTLKMRPMDRSVYIPNGKTKVAQRPEEWGD